MERGIQLIAGIYMIKLSSKAKIILAAGIVLTAAAIATTAAMAYLLGREESSGQVTVGVCKIKVEEEFNPPEKVTPGCSITKKPWVDNIGTVPCYVRMRADISDGQIEPYLNIDFNTTEWSTKRDDGYYYYLGTDKDGGILTPETSTPPLFTTVSIPDTIPQDILADFDIFVYAEAVQAEGFGSANEAWLRYTPDSTI